MKAVVQRVKDACVEVDGKKTGSIDYGLLIYLGISDCDTEDTCIKMADKISKLRIFRDNSDKMNLSVKDCGGSFLVISQFTLFADISQGNRPYFGNAGKPEHAEKLYRCFMEILRKKGNEVACGVFGAHMNVRYTNDGPVTICIDSDELFNKG